MTKARALRRPLNSEANPIGTNDGTDDPGTEANPIVIKDDSEEEGPETDPIVIKDDVDDCVKQETPGQNYSTRHMEPLSMSLFWANLGSRGFHVPQNKPID
ncbi:hypothetical protein N7475_001480 [Penicillium sp. IBT 31633x]|nr:hypothetical protein N7475_001480 [Penicillium sp. IBT 31633x]